MSEKPGFRKRVQKVVLWTAYFLSIALLGIYLKKQYANVFIEAQYIHIPFLDDTVHHTFSFRHFLSFYSEHLFPGYNLILFVSLKLFNLNDRFELALNWIVISANALLLAWTLFMRDPEGNFKTLVGVGFILLSVSSVHNQMWGMALASMIGVTGVIFYSLSIQSLYGPRKSSWRLVFISIAVVATSVLLFLGAYAIGVGGILALLLILHARHRLPFDAKIRALAIATASLLILYALIVKLLTGTVSSAPMQVASHFRDAVGFILVLVGSSVLGKASSEWGLPLAAYYVTGFSLLIASVAFLVRLVWVKNEFRQRNQLFLGCLLTYSLTNVLVVTIARYNNGIEGGMGQWYLIHTYLIPLALIALVADFYAHNLNKFIIRAGALTFLLLVFSTGYFGFWAEYYKAAAAKAWKANLLTSIPNLLANEDLAEIKSDPFKHLLWEFDDVRAGLHLFYENKLWIFNQPYVVGLLGDSSFTNRVSILCPVDSTRLKLQIVRNASANSAISLQAGDGRAFYPLTESAKSFSIPLVRPIKKIEITPSLLASSENNRTLGKILDIACLR